MSFEIIRKTGEIAFVANPIAFEVKTSGEAEIEIRLRVGAQEVFSASYVPFGDRIHFDIAEILQPFVTSGPLEDSEDLILPVSGFMAGYTLEVKGRETRTLTGLPGRQMIGTRRPSSESTQPCHRGLPGCMVPLTKSRCTGASSPRSACASIVRGSKAHADTPPEMTMRSAPAAA